MHGAAMPLHLQPISCHTRAQSTFTFPGCVKAPTTTTSAIQAFEKQLN
jgi:hypothetical protein